MPQTKSKPRVGDRCWFVEWVYQLAWEDDDDSSENRTIDRDRCKSKVRRAATKEDAERIAREAWPEAVQCFGHVTYGEAVFEPYDEDDAARYPYVGYWDSVGEDYVYEGD